MRSDYAGFDLLRLKTHPPNNDRLVASSDNEKRGFLVHFVRRLEEAQKSRVDKDLVVESTRLDFRKKRFILLDKICSRANYCFKQGAKWASGFPVADLDSHSDFVP